LKTGLSDLGRVSDR